MKKLIITADIHGSHTAWLTIKALMGKTDGLAVAGDLFDTRYGSYSDPDFQPESIKKDLKSFHQPFYYVYGNCDVPGFSPGFESSKLFTAFNRELYLYHGHRRPESFHGADIVVQGHTHLCALERVENSIFLNPGSIARPRNSLFTYGILDSSGVRLVELKTGNTLARIEFQY